MPQVVLLPLSLGCSPQKYSRFGFVRPSFLKFDALAPLLSAGQIMVSDVPMIYKPRPRQIGLSKIVLRFRAKKGLDRRPFMLKFV